jgi:hypothetical protein
MAWHRREADGSLHHSPAVRHKAGRLIGPRGRTAAAHRATSPRRRTLEQTADHRLPAVPTLKRAEQRQPGRQSTGHAGRHSCWGLFGHTGIGDTPARQCRSKRTGDYRTASVALGCHCGGTTSDWHRSEANRIEASQQASPASRTIVGTLVTGKFTERAMKHMACACPWSCIALSSSEAAEIATRGRRMTEVN